MVITKRYLLRLFFLLEIIIFVGIYFFSAQGLQVLRSMRQDNLEVKNKIVGLQEEIVGLQEEVTEWENNSFYKEKIAREELQMAKTGDEVYFL